MHGSDTAINLTDALEPWHSFYSLLGSASATMIGLLFVAATLASGVFSNSRQSAQRVFLTASVVHFGTTLAASLILVAPVRAWLSLGAMITAAGLFGLGYFGLALRGTLRDGMISRIDLEDRTWYLALPVAAYLAQAGSGLLLAAASPWGLPALALSVGILLLIAVHNAWDITIWTITRPKD